MGVFDEIEADEKASGNIFDEIEADESPKTYQGPKFLQDLGKEVDAAPAEVERERVKAEQTRNLVNTYARPIAKGLAGAGAAIIGAPSLATGLPGLAAEAFGVGAAMTAVDKGFDLAMGENKTVTEDAGQFIENSAFSLGGPANTVRKAIVQGATTNAIGGEVSRTLRGENGTLSEEVSRAGSDAVMGGLTAGVMTTAPRVIEATGKVIMNPKQTAAAIKEKVNLPKRIKQTAEKTGASIVENSLSKEPEIASQAAKNLAKSIEVADEIGGGWSVGLGEATGDPRTLSLQRKLQMQDVNAQAVRAEAEMTNLKAEEEFLNKKFKDGGLSDEQLSDALAALKQKRDTLGKQSADAADALEARAQQLSAVGKDDAGAALRERAKQIRAGLKSEAGKLYDEVDRTHQLDDPTVDEWVTRTEARSDAINEAYGDPAKAPKGILQRVLGGLKEYEAQFTKGDEVRAVINGREFKGTVDDIQMAKDGGNRVPVYKVKTEKGTFEVRWDNVRDIPKVKAPEAPPIEPYHSRDVKHGARAVHSEQGPGTWRTDPSTMWKAFVPDVPLPAGQKKIELPSRGAEGQLKGFRREGEPAPAPKVEVAPVAPPETAAPTGPKRKPVTFGDLLDYRKQIVGKIREARDGQKFEMAQNLGEVLSDVEAVIAKAAQNPNGAPAVAALRKANDFYRDVYVPRVRQGATGKVLRTNRSGPEGMSIDSTAAGRAYFKPGDAGLQAAQDFKKTFGADPEARASVESFAAADLYDVATSGGSTAVNPVAVTNWLKKHATAIKELGLDKKFGSIKQAVKTLEGARGMQAEFEKSQFAKAIDADPEKAMGTLFGGGNAKATQEAMRKLVSQLKGSPKAINGLKRAFADHMRAQTRLSAENATTGERATSLAKTQSFFEKFDGAMQVLYSKEEMAAMNTLREAVRIKSRINQPTSGVPGSQTADLVQNITKKALTESLPALLRPIVGHLDGVWKGAIQEYTTRAMYDPRMARKLVDISLLAQKDPKAATAELKAEIGQTITDTGPTMENRRVYDELRTKVNTITDSKMQAAVIAELKAAHAGGTISPEQFATEALKIAETDPLTGLGNQLKFDSTIDGKFEMSSSWDLSGMTAVNNTLGHGAGDELLRGFASILKSNGMHGQSARKGGDEFAIGLGANDQMKAQKILEDFEKSVLYYTKDGKTYKLSEFQASYGLGKTFDDADAELLVKHEAKRQARGGREKLAIKIEEVANVGD